MAQTAYKYCYSIEVRWLIHNDYKKMIFSVIIWGIFSGGINRDKVTNQ